MHRAAARDGAQTERGFHGTPSVFAASRERFAALVDTVTVTFEESDSFSTAFTNAVLSGRFEEPAEVLSGSLPRRGDRAATDGRCSSTRSRSTSTATASRSACSATSARPTTGRGTTASWWSAAAHGRRSRWAAGLRPRRRARRPLRRLGERPQRAGEVVVRDLETGADVVRLTAHDLGTRGFDELALQADGTVVFRYSNRSFQRIAWAAPGTPGARVLDPRLVRRARAGGRPRAATSARSPSAASPASCCCARSPAARCGGSRSSPSAAARVGHLDLDADARDLGDAADAARLRRAPRGPARIVVREL